MANDNMEFDFHALLESTRQVKEGEEEADLGQSEESDRKTLGLPSDKEHLEGMGFVDSWSGGKFNLGDKVVLRDRPGAWLTKKAKTHKGQVGTVVAREKGAAGLGGKQGRKYAAKFDDGVIVLEPSQNWQLKSSPNQEE